MATARRSTATKRERSIPVKVNVDPRPAPTTLPPLAPTSLTPPPPAKPTAKVKAVVNRPVQALKAPVHSWSIEQRQRLMWWLVGGGVAVVLIGWAAVARYEFSTGTNQPNLFSDVTKLLRSIHLGSTTTKPSPAQQEIDKLDQQVFPQFQQ